MKKLFVVIIILAIIFISMLIYKNNINSNNVTVDEVKKIETYIKKIYMYKETTQQALPEFEDINSASEEWIWKVVKRDLENYELSYQNIQEKTKEIFGENLKKEFPKDGTSYIVYDKENDKYYSQRDIIDNKLDKFIINKIEKIKDGYKIEIIEYIENHIKIEEAEANRDIDDTNQLDYDVYIENLNGETLSIIKSINAENSSQTAVKENLDRFTKKEVYLQKDQNSNLHVVKVE